MSHELRTPLNGIMGYSQILLKDTHSDKQGKGLAVIYQCGSHLLTLINDILDIAKIEAGKLEINPAPCYFPSLLQGVVEISRIKAEPKNINFFYVAPENLPLGILIDEKRLRQVLLNLLSNAIKFTDRGSVTFEVAIQSLSESMVKIHFRVIDTGVGLTNEQQKIIFLPFEQVGSGKQQSQGSGLGLAITQSLLEKMGSSITVTSELAQGSTFEFSLDCSLEDDWIGPNTSTNLGKIMGYSGKRRTIMIVDDRWENRSVIFSLLKPLGFEVLQAKNAQEAMVEINQNFPDLIITDLKMPLMDGWELLEKLSSSEIYQNIKIIVSSASVFEEDRHQSFSAGADDFLPKPVDSEALYRMLGKYLELEWLYQKSPRNDSLRRSQNISSPKITDTIPSQDELRTLLALAMEGNLSEIRERLDELSQLSPEYQAFIAKISLFLDNFQIKDGNLK